MKKVIIIVTLFTIVFGIFICTNTVHAAEQAIDQETESKLVEIKEDASKSLQDYQEKYGSDVYGTVAYILNIYYARAYIKTVKFHKNIKSP